MKYINIKIPVLLAVVAISCIQVYAQSYLPPNRNNKMIWGVAGHPYDRIAYCSATDTRAQRQARYQKQIDIAKKGNMAYYRVGVAFDRNNNINTMNPAGSTYDYIGLLLDMLKANNLKPLFLVGPSESVFPKFDKSDRDNYYYGFKQGSEIARNFGDRITYYELSNEIQASTFKQDGVVYAGDNISNYDPARVRSTAAYLKGMHAGIKSQDSDAKTVFNFDWHHYGYFDALKQYAPDLGQYSCNATFTEFDIVGWHVYSAYGDITATRPYGPESTPVNIMQVLDRQFPDKEIWVTEFNSDPPKHYEDQTEAEKQTQMNWISQTLDQMYRFKGSNGAEKIKAIFYYELYDMRTENPGYGLYSCTDYTCSNPVEKSFYPFIKMKIEDYDKGVEDYIRSLYADWGCNFPDAAGLDFWATKMKSANDRRAITQGMMYEGYLENYIKTAYLNLFDRSADQGGLDYALSSFRTNSSYGFEDFLARMISSKEFWNRAIGNTTNVGASINYTNRTHCELFVKRVYQRVFGRDADPGGLQYWTDYIYNSHSSTAHYNYVMDQLFSKEYVDLFISSQLYSLFESTAILPEFGMNLHYAMVNRLKTQRDVILDLVCSNTYWNKALNNGYDLRFKTGANVVSQPGGVQASQTDPSFFSPNPKPVVQYNYPIYTKACMFTSNPARLAEGASTFALPVKESRQFILAPNPVDDKLIIYLSEFTSGVVVEIVDLSGQTVKSYSNEEGTSIIELNTSVLGQGLYLCKVKSGEEVKVLKFIKN